MKRVSILGSGWLGLPLAQHLAQRYTVRVSTRSPIKQRDLIQQGFDAHVVEIKTNNFKSSPDFLDCDILIICVPPSKLSGEYSAIIASLSNALAAQTQRPYQLLISSTSVFAANQGSVSESSRPAPQNERGAELLVAEKLLFSEKATIVRFGGLVGEDRHPGQFLAGRKELDGGDRPVNLIHQQDAIGILSTILEQGRWGEIFHAVSDEHRSRQEFYGLASLALGLKQPQFIEKTSDRPTLIQNNKVKRLLGYEFHYPNLQIFLEP